MSATNTSEITTQHEATSSPNMHQSTREAALYDSTDGNNTEEIGPYDVLCGRSKIAFNNIGNRRFRVLVSLSLDKYVNLALTRRDKSEVIREVINSLKCSGGRFLMEKNGKYIELSKRQTHEKVGHAVRDMVKAREKGCKGVLDNPYSFMDISESIESIQLNSSPQFAASKAEEQMDAFSSSSNSQCAPLADIALQELSLKSDLITTSTSIDNWGVLQQMNETTNIRLPSPRREQNDEYIVSTTNFIERQVHGQGEGRSFGHFSQSVTEQSEHGFGMSLGEFDLEYGRPPYQLQVPSIVPQPVLEPNLSSATINTFAAFDREISSSTINPQIFEQREDPQGCTDFQQKTSFNSFDA